MSIVISIHDLIIIISVILGIFILAKLFSRVIVPWIISKRTKYIEKNPNWLTSKIKNVYYGFYDIDFIIVENPFKSSMELRVSENKKRLELLLSNELTTNDTEEIARVALAGKIKLKYNLWFPDKPIYWLSILCFMLDGGSIKEEDASFNKIDNKNANK